ncbi:MAG: NrtA/SsuA/CpmA family ABC transporter substrate-binding protein [Synergistaceae bacterium]|nr:NrtA/SsuA/CpmA family ABC transporter substrate-binding protein [Synergistaceae bacterium]
MIKKILSALLAVSCAACAVLLFTGSAARTGKPGKDYSGLRSIAVTYVTSPLNVPSIVERERGFFAEAFSPFGLDVEYFNLTTGPEQTQALAAGSIQFLHAVGAASVILSAANGADIRIVSAYSRSPAAFRLFTADESIKSAAGLAGKKVAGPKGTILHQMLLAYLNTAGLTEDDVNFLHMDILLSQAALAAGHVDAALLAGPVAYGAEQAGYFVIATGEGLIDATIVNAVTGRFYERHPELAEAFLQAQRATLAWMTRNNDEALEISARETGLDISAVTEMFPMYDFRAEISESDIEALKRTQDFMLENGMIENPVDIRSLLY